MNPLITNQWVLTWLCVCPAHESTSVKKKVAYVAFTLMVFIANLSALAATLTFITKFVFVDLKNSLFAFIITVGYTGIVYIMVFSLLLRHKINAIFVELSEIYKASK